MLELLVEVVDRERAVDAHRVVVDLLERLVRQVVLVLDLADDLLEQVLERDDALHRAVLVDDDRHVLVRARGTRRAAARGPSSPGTKYGVRSSSSITTLSIPLLVERREEVADVEDADDLVERARGRPGSACTASRRPRRGIPRAGRSTEIATTSGRVNHDVVHLLLGEVEDLVEHLLLDAPRRRPSPPPRRGQAHVLLACGRRRPPAPARSRTAGRPRSPRPAATRPADGRSGRARRSARRARSPAAPRAGARSPSARARRARR